jgi:diacylglycerol kinase (ATP)
MSWKKRIRSFYYAFKGLADVVRSQANMRIHLFSAATALFAAWFFNISPGEWLALVLVIGLVLSAEAMNTAIEYLTDLISPTQHPLAGKAKDAAAAAVLLCAFIALVVGSIIFIPHVVRFLTH